MKLAVKVFSIMVAFYLICLGAQMGFDMTKEKKVETAPTKKLGYNAIVRLHDAATGRFFCSGAVVSNKHIVTAAHCVDYYPANAEVVEIRSSSGLSFAVPVLASVLAANSRNDQALLIGSFTHFAKLPMELRPKPIINAFFNPSNNIILCGYPYGGKLLCLPFRQPRQYFFQVQGLSHVYPGMSGGPVFDMHTGRIVAVNTAATEGFVIVSPLTEIFHSLDLTQ